MRYLDLVQINTDTIFDEEGIPVSIRNGAKGRVIEPHEYMTQVAIWWEGSEYPEILGVPTAKLQLIEAHDETCKACAAH